MTSGINRPPSATLPDALAVFPLSGAFLLPRARLPLNIFEPRYLNMTQDALTSDCMMGMVQPRETGAETFGNTAPIYDVGCAGHITSFSETDDGRYLIELTGLCRFRVRGELEMVDGYRRVEPDFKTLFGRSCRRRRRNGRPRSPAGGGAAISREPWHGRRLVGVGAAPGRRPGHGPGHGRAIRCVREAGALGVRGPCRAVPTSGFLDRDSGL